MSNRFLDKDIWAKDGDKEEPPFAYNIGYNSTYSQQGGNPVERLVHNGVLNKITNYLAETTSYGGCLKWDETVVYGQGAIVTALNGVSYTAIKNVPINKNPLDADDDHWVMTNNKLSGDKNMSFTNDGKNNIAIKLTDDLDTFAKKDLSNVTVSTIYNEFLHENKEEGVENKISLKNGKIQILTTVEDATEDQSGLLKIVSEGQLSNLDNDVDALTIKKLVDFIAKNKSPLGLGMPIGSSCMWHTQVIPDNFLEMNGQKFDKLECPILYEILGTDELPDLRGQFVRGWDHGASVDSGRVLGSFQTDALQNIQGSIGNIMESTWEGDSSTGSMYSSNIHEIKHANGSYTGLIKNINFDASRVARTADETRPTNFSAIYIIKAK